MQSSLHTQCQGHNRQACKPGRATQPSSALWPSTSSTACVCCKAQHVEAKLLLQGRSRQICVLQQHTQRLSTSEHSILQQQGLMQRSWVQPQLHMNLTMQVQQLSAVHSAACKRLTSPCHYCALHSTVILGMHAPEMRCTQVGESRSCRCMLSTRGIHGWSICSCDVDSAWCCLEMYTKEVNRSVRDRQRR